MPLSDDKTTVTAVIPTEIKDRLKQIAKLRRWTLSQAVGALIEDCLEKWEEDLGVLKPTRSPKKKS